MLLAMIILMMLDLYRRSMFRDDHFSHLFKEVNIIRRALSSDVATILVGPDEHQFKVHEALLSYSSDFFRAALRGNFTEGRDMIVSLPDATSAIFDLFVQWLYNHNGCWERKSYSGLTTLSNFRVGDEIRALNLTEYADLFHLADYLACPTLQRDIQQMFEMGNTGCQECPNANEITYVYENFEKRGSGAFFINFVVQFFTESAPLSAYGQPDEYPIAFWTDIALAQRKHRRRAEQKLAAYKESYDSLKLTCS